MLVWEFVQCIHIEKKTVTERLIVTFFLKKMESILSLCHVPDVPLIPGVNCNNDKSRHIGPSCVTFLMNALPGACYSSGQPIPLQCVIVQVKSKAMSSSAPPVLSTTSVEWAGIPPPWKRQKPSESPENLQFCPDSVLTDPNPALTEDSTGDYNDDEDEDDDDDDDANDEDDNDENDDDPEFLPVPSQREALRSKRKKFPSLSAINYQILLATGRRQHMCSLCGEPKKGHVCSVLKASTVKRRQYTCRSCGNIKKGHVCSYQA